jgi:hypothetical protein
MLYSLLLYNTSWLAYTIRGNPNYATMIRYLSSHRLHHVKGTLQLKNGLDYQMCETIGAP